MQQCQFSKKDGKTYLEKEVQGKSNSSDGGSVKIDIKAFIHVDGLAITQVGMGNLVADILADAEGDISKGGGEDEVED